VNVFFSAGEASGDAYAAALCHRLRDRLPGASFLGIGASRSEAAGIRLVANSARWGAMGIVEAVRVSPRVQGGFRRTLRELSRETPGLFVPIDFGFLNIRLARHAHRLGWRVVYFVPPGSWRRTKQGADLPQITDAIVTPFSWSADMLNDRGATARWFGHPIRELAGNAPRAEVPGRIAVLPGSRTHEAYRNLVPVAEAVRLINEAADSSPGSPVIREVEIAAAPGLAIEALQRAWQQLCPRVPAELTVGDVYGVLRRARAAVVCSGTATLEAAVCGCPMVVIYRASWLMELEFKIRRPKFDYISLPNILLQRGLLPELIQHDASPERIALHLSELLREGSDDRLAQLAGFEDLDRVLGPSDALDRAADWMVEIATATRSHGPNS